MFKKTKSNACPTTSRYDDSSGRLIIKKKYPISISNSDISYAKEQEKNQRYAITYRQR